jgi:hypothetical protein
MINRPLTSREKQICELIPDPDYMSFRIIVDMVRRDIYGTMYNERKELKRLHNQ